MGKAAGESQQTGAIPALMCIKIYAHSRKSRHRFRRRIFSQAENQAELKHGFYGVFTGLSADTKNNLKKMLHRVSHLIDSASRYA
jgi:hypothetical protein